MQDHGLLGKNGWAACPRRGLFPSRKQYHLSIINIILGREDTTERASGAFALTWSRWAASVVLGPGAVEAPLHSACSRSIPARCSHRPRPAEVGGRPRLRTKQKLESFLILCQTFSLPRMITRWCGGTRDTGSLEAVHSLDWKKVLSRDEKKLRLVSQR